MTSFILAAKCISSLPRHYLYNFYPKWRGYTAASLISTDIIVIKMLQTSLLARIFPAVDNFYFLLLCKFILTKSILFSDVGKKQLKFNTKSYLLTLFCYCHSFSCGWGILQGHNIFFWSDLIVNIVIQCSLAGPKSILTCKGLYHVLTMWPFDIFWTPYYMWYQWDILWRPPYPISMDTDI